MSGGHGHGHGHGHLAERSGRARRRLGFVLVLTASYMVAEVIGGLISGSLALLSDAGHMLSDVAALALSLFAMWSAERPATPQRTFGYFRTEILAALINGATLLAIAVFISIEAFERLSSPRAEGIDGPLMLAVATGGLVMNVIGLAVLHRGKAESLNVRGAWLHMLADGLGSVGAMVSGVLIWTLGWTWADPVASVLIAVLIVYSSWSLIREAVSVLMEGAPGNVDVDAVREALLAFDEVAEVHDLHVWSISSGRVCMSTHVVTVHEADAGSALLKRLAQKLAEAFGLRHVTIQLESREMAAECSDGGVHG